MNNQFSTNPNYNSNSAYQQFNTNMNYSNYGMAMTNITTVKSMEEVMSKMQPFGSNYIYVHENDPIVYIKHVDNNGQMSIQTYDIKLRENKSDYVSREEFNKLLEKLEKYENSKEVIISESDAK